MKIISFLFSMSIEKPKSENLIRRLNNGQKIKKIFLLPKLYLFKKRANPGLYLFSCFSATFLNKSCWLLRDSKSDYQSRRRARWKLDHHHGLKSYLFKKWANAGLIFRSFQTTFDWKTVHFSGIQNQTDQKASIMITWSPPPIRPPTREATRLKRFESQLKQVKNWHPTV